MDHIGWAIHRINQANAERQAFNNWKLYLSTIGIVPPPKVPQPSYFTMLKYIPLIRQIFTDKMAYRLAQNAHRGIWQNYHPDRERAQAQLTKACTDLIWEIQRKGYNVGERAADVANIAMKIDEEFGVIKGPEAYAPPPPPPVPKHVLVVGSVEQWRVFLEVNRNTCPPNERLIMQHTVSDMGERGYKPERTTIVWLPSAVDAVTVKGLTSLRELKARGARSLKMDPTDKLPEGL